MLIARMKILMRVLFLLFLLIGVLIAVSNRQPVLLALWPLPRGVVMPVYLLVIIVLLLGVLVGLGAGLVGRAASSAAGRECPQRGQPPRARGPAASRRPCQRRERQRQRAPPAPRDQKAIERQSALVAPQLSPPPRGTLP